MEERRVKVNSDGGKKEIEKRRKKQKQKISGVSVVRGPLAEFEAEAESQLVLLDLSVSVDVTVTHQGFPELVQVRATDAGLE